MRILFEAFWWSRGPQSGRTVVKELIQAWLRTHHEDEVLVSVPADDVLAARATFPAARIVALRSPQHAVAATLEVPWVSAKHHADITFVQNYTPIAGRSVTFIHDVLFQDYPEWFSLPERAYFGAMTPLARRATLILTSSETEATRIRRNNPRLKRVAAIGLGVSSGLSRAEPTRPEGVGDESFLLVVGRLNVRKNLGSAIEGAARSSSLRVGTRVYIVGETQGRVGNAQRVIDQACNSGMIKYLGSVSDAELSWLYRKAEALLFLSLGEGFGLPVVEAMHFGCRMILSDIPVFREVAGDEAIYVDPSNPEAIASAIDDLMESKAPGPTKRSDNPDDVWDRATARARRLILET